MRTSIRNYLYPHERRSLFAILVFGLCLFIFQKYIPRLIENHYYITEDVAVLPLKNPKNNTIETTHKRDVKLNNKTPNPRIPKKTFRKSYPKKQTVAWNYEGTPIDLNIASASELSQLNLSPYVISNILKYRDAGGYFSAIDDVFKIYGVDSVQVSKLEQHLFFTTHKPKVSKSFVQRDISKSKVDLNLSDAEELQSVRGIGEVLSSRIIKYRDLLGGFSNVEQLQEVYGLSNEHYNSIKAQVKSSEVESLLFINTFNAFQLRKHPYISNELANNMVSYRMQHGPFFRLEDLESLHTLPKEQLSKLGPYISFRPTALNTSQ